MVRIAALAQDSLGPYWPFGSCLMVKICGSLHKTSGIFELWNLKTCELSTVSIVFLTVKLSGDSNADLSDDFFQP